VSHGFAARMVFQTGLLKLLTSKGKRVVAIVPDSSDENLIRFAKQQNVELIEYAEPKSIWSENFKVRRKYILENIEENPALLEKHIRAVRFNSSRHPWRRIRPYLHWALYKFCRQFPGIRKWYLGYESRFLESQEVGRILSTIKPKLVVSTYPVTLSEARFLHTAKNKGIKTVSHLLSWDNISSKGHFPALADKYISWGPIMTGELKAYYGIDERDILETGVPHFDAHLNVKEKGESSEWIERIGLIPTKPYLFFGMSAPRFTPKEIDIVERLAQAVESDFFGDQMQLVIRPHPQNVTGNLADLSWLKRLQDLRSERVVIDTPKVLETGINWSMNAEDMIAMSNLMSGSSVVLNSGSTISIDALMLGRPVILTSFDGDDKLPY
jgi:CDP-glycerol glycerophosphotransferase (TagB/SpsB family)